MRCTQNEETIRGDPCHQISKHTPPVSKLHMFKDMKRKHDIELLISLEVADVTLFNVEISLLVWHHINTQISARLVVVNEELSMSAYEMVYASGRTKLQYCLLTLENVIWDIIVVRWAYGIRALYQLSVLQLEAWSLPDRLVILFPLVLGPLPAKILQCQSCNRRVTTINLHA